MADTGDRSKLRQNCPYGFSCASMMLQPGIVAHDCENLEECKSLAHVSGASWDAIDQPTFDLVQYVEERRQYWSDRDQAYQEQVERIRYRREVRQHEAAVIMLQQRGNPLSFESFNLNGLIPQIQASIATIAEKLNTLNQNYIAPFGVEAHIYSVKRPARNSFPDSWTDERIKEAQTSYYYHKMLSKTPQFRAIKTITEEEQRQWNRRDRSKCKTIHLGKSFDARNIQGRIGVERRNRLAKIKTRLNSAAKALQEAVELMEQEYSYEDVLAASEVAEQQTTE